MSHNTLIVLVAVVDDIIPLNGHVKSKCTLIQGLDGQIQGCMQRSYYWSSMILLTTSASLN